MTAPERERAEQEARKMVIAQVGMTTAEATDALVALQNRAHNDAIEAATKIVRAARQGERSGALAVLEQDIAALKRKE